MSCWIQNGSRWSSRSGLPWECGYKCEYVARLAVICALFDLSAIMGATAKTSARSQRHSLREFLRPHAPCVSRRRVDGLLSADLYSTKFLNKTKSFFLTSMFKFPVQGANTSPRPLNVEWVPLAQGPLWMAEATEGLRPSLASIRGPRGIGGTEG